MMNKANTLTALQSKLRTDVRWAQRGLLAIFRNQTADEQNEATVRYHNQMGFRCMDSIILTSFANQLQQRGSLSPKQMNVVHKLMPKYARQLMKFYGDKIQLAL
jgi:succinate dehydrogenase flavin-adding protein (antitoxin of CptAB toxin-antitoxin module)